MLKMGANEIDQKRIPKLADQGLTVAQISKELSIEQVVVEKFMPVPELKVESKTKTKKE